MPPVQVERIKSASPPPKGDWMPWLAPWLNETLPLIWNWPHSASTPLGTSMTPTKLETVHVRRSNPLEMPWPCKTPTPRRSTTMRSSPLVGKAPCNGRQCGAKAPI